MTQSLASEQDQKVNELNSSADINPSWGHVTEWVDLLGIRTEHFDRNAEIVPLLF